MSEKAPETLKIKPKEVLEQQHDLSNLAGLSGRHRAWSVTTEMPERFKDLTPEEMMKEVKKLKSQRVQDLKGEERDIIREYNSYVENLRQLRREQREQIGEGLRESKGASDRREAFLKAVSWSGPLQRKILEKMQTKDGEYSQRIFTDTQIIEAAKTEEGFVDMLHDSVDLAPGKLFNILSELELILPRDRFISLVDVTLDKKPLLVGIYHKRLAKIYGEKFPEMFSAAAIKNPSGIYIQTLVKDETLRKSLGEEEVKNIVELCGNRDPEFLADAGSDLWESGLLGKKSLQSIVVTHLENMPSYKKASTIRAVWEHLDEEGREKCRTMMQKEFNENSFYRFSSLNDYKTILDEEEINKKARFLLLERKDHLRISNTLDQVQEYLTPEEFQKWLRDVVFSKHTHINFDNAIQEEIMKNDWLSEEEKTTFVQKLIEEDPRSVFHSPHIFLKDKSKEEQGKMLAELAYELPISEGLSQLSEWLPHVADTKEAQRDVLMQYCLRDGNISFLRGYTSKQSPSDDVQLFRSLLSKEDVLDLLNKKAEIVPEDVFGTLPSIRNLLGNDTELKAFIEKIRGTSQHEFLSHLDKVAYLYEPEELLKIVEDSLPTIRLTGVIFDHVEVWGPKVGRDKVIEIFEKHKEYLSLMPSLLGKFTTVIPDLKIQDLFEIMRESNPAAVLYFANPANENSEYRTAGITIKPEEMREEALANQELMAFAPKLFQEFWSTVDIHSDMKDERIKIQVKKAAFAYLHSMTIRRNGLEEKHKEIIEKCRSSADEEQVMTMLISYINLKSTGLSVGENESVWTSKDDIEKALFRSVEQVFGQEQREGSADMKKFMEMMKTPGPFVSYLSQYHRFPLHKQILNDMFVSIARGRYEEWKYGQENDFESFKEKKWIPEHLSKDQYAVWRADDKTSLFESLQSSASDVAKEIRKILADNAEHLQVQAFEEGVGDPASIINEVKEELRLLGAELAALGKQVSLLKREGRAEGADMEELLEKKKNIEEMRAKLVKNRDAVRLSILTPEEVTSGYLMEGGKKIQSIDKFIRSLRDSIPSEGYFVMDRIALSLTNLKSSGAEKEDVVCEDTGNPKITLEIGANPVDSCQHYESGSHNDCLLGYTEPNTKVLIVRNNKGNIIARSILRLLEDQKGEVSLQVERVYSTTASSGARKAIFEHAMKKAELLGVDLRGDSDDIAPEIGFAPKEERPEALMSSGARAPKVYVDSAGGSKSWGRYRINDAAVIIRKV
jgi:hypothetical protein